MGRFTHTHPGKKWPWRPKNERCLGKGDSHKKTHNLQFLGVLVLTYNPFFWWLEKPAFSHGVLGFQRSFHTWKTHADVNGVYLLGSYPSYHSFSSRTVSTQTASLVNRGRPPKKKHVFQVILGCGFLNCWNIDPLQVVIWHQRSFTLQYIQLPGDSSRDLFGMVKTWPFQGQIVTSKTGT